jgi:hypothetical protein
MTALAALKAHCLGRVEIEEDRPLTDIAWHFPALDRISVICVKHYVVLNYAYR